MKEEIHYHVIAPNEEPWPTEFVDQQSAEEFARRMSRSEHEYHAYQYLMRVERVVTKCSYDVLVDVVALGYNGKLYLVQE